MRIASVVLDIPTQSLDKAYSYRVPETDSVLRVGSTVLVPFGHRDVVGFVMDIGVAESSSEGDSLKEIKQVLSEPYFTPVGARCARFLADRYVAPLSSCVRLFTPPGGVARVERVDGRWELTRPVTQKVDDRWVVRLAAADDYVPRKSAVKQITVLAALEQGDLRVAELTAEYGSVNAVLQTLEKKGIVRIESRRRFRAAQDTSEAFSSRIRPRPRLTDEQQRACEVIEEVDSHRNGGVVVLDGVTGSGKTEVYLCAIEKVLEQGRNAIVLVPEISLTPQTVARFRGRFGDKVAVLHSRMSKGERFDQWDFIRSGDARVVVGARSALFAPLEDVGIVIIDEEHESSYKQDQAPRYVTRDVARWLVREQGATLVLGSATPSIEALHRCETDDTWHRVCMNHRANGKPLPEIHVVDMSREFGSGNRQMFSRSLREALIETIDKGQKAVLLLNQRGFAQFLLCRDCGFVPTCESCSTSLTYHEQGGRLVCHHCGYEQGVYPVCPECGSPYLKRFGAGTQRVEAELRVLLEGHPCDIIRMDADTTSRKGSHQRLLEKFATADAAVLLGTQMIAKGLDFDEVTLVGVINADTMLRLPDFRSAERTFDLIEQVAGRSGRGELRGGVIVQTYTADAPAIRAAAHYDRGAFLAGEYESRRELGYPPFVRLANLLVWGSREDEVKALGRELFRDISHLIDRSGFENWVIFPPTPCVLERLKGVWRYHLLIKAPPSDDLSACLLPYFRSRKVRKDVHVALDIDPMSLL